ncbi:putative membrane protein [Sorangium cellulosum So ce56]|uniref:Membrane protein n=1 Tax=Sorangium cellulosum (strain So ce56) TaxID=448385 RepID=A9EWV3_SORC5|nr:lysylphosphatidylglycerol synthase domain-containing protein [Sorangium cellulosum]CAN94354.1 putative membrane protein [Sorangium cellulosum So ce56]
MTLLASDAARDAHDEPLRGARSRPGTGAVALRWLGVAVAAAALWSTLRGADLPSVAALIASVSAPMMALALVPNLVARLFQAEASRRVFDTHTHTHTRTRTRNPASGRPAPFSRYLALTLSTEALSMSVPAGAALSESVTFYLLHRWCGIPGPQGVAGIAARRALIVLANAAYVAIALALGFGHLERASRPLIGGPGLPWLVVLSGLGLLVVALALGGALFSGTVASRVFAWLKRLPGQRVKAYVDARAAAFSATDRHAAALGERRAALAAAALLLLGMWLAEGAETYLFLRLLGVDVSLSEVLSFEVVLALLRAAAFMVPAGLGVQDAGYVAFLTALGVPAAATVGAAFVLIKRAKELVWIALGLLVFFGGRAAFRPAPAPMAGSEATRGRDGVVTR